MLTLARARANSCVARRKARWIAPFQLLKDSLDTLDGRREAAVGAATELHSRNNAIRSHHREIIGILGFAVEHVASQWHGAHPVRHSHCLEHQPRHLTKWAPSSSVTPENNLNIMLIRAEKPRVGVEEPRWRRRTGVGVQATPRRNRT